MLEEIDELHDLLLGAFIASHIFEGRLDLLVFTIDSRIRLRKLAEGTTATSKHVAESTAFLVGALARLASSTTTGVSTLVDLVEGCSSQENNESIEHHGLHLVLGVYVLDGDELVEGLAHLSLDQIQLGKEALLRAKDHLVLDAIVHGDLSLVIKDSAASILGDVDLLHFVLE